MTAETITQHAPATQIDRYVAAGVLEHCGMTEQAFREWLAPLTDTAAPDEYDPATGAIPSLLVLRGAIMDAGRALAAVVVRGAPGFVDMNPTTPDTFATIDGVVTPDADAYVLTGFDPGDAYRNQPPSAALPQILSAGRSPVTIEEALAAVVLYPELLADKHAFSIIGSRSSARGVTKSVPALWISRGAPRLGWCWNDNPHSWLGSASCAGRVRPLR